MREFDAGATSNAIVELLLDRHPFLCHDYRRTLGLSGAIIFQIGIGRLIQIDTHLRTYLEEGLESLSFTPPP